MASEQKASNDEVDSDGDSNFFVPKELFNADKSNRYTVHEMIGSVSSDSKILSSYNNLCLD